MPDKDKKTKKPISFIASLSPVSSAIQLDGNGDGAIVKLEIPRSHVNAVLELQKMAGKVLLVAVKEYE